MPIVPVEKTQLFEALGQEFTDEEFDHLCFEFGIELDDITSEKEMARREKGDAAAEGLSDAVIYKIDVPANRYDILCLEGLARSLNVFMQKAPLPVFRLTNPPELLTLTVAPSTGSIRPYVVAAVLRNVQFNKARYNSFLDLQDQLHRNICRRRTLVAIGTHDLDHISAPFRYEANAPEDISFVPLAQTRTFNARDLLEFYETDASVKHIKPYVPIIKDSPVYPVILDSNRTVLSLPPIINGEHSKMSADTRNVFIECTATDLAKAKIVLNQMVTCFSEYCHEKFTVEPVKVVYESDGHSYVTPDLTTRVTTAAVKEINSTVGVNLAPPKICELLTKMQLVSTYDYETDSVSVQVPPTRPDILHQCDIIEDVAIAYGYNNIQTTLPKGATVGRQQPMNRLTDLVRLECASMGFTECLNMLLVGTKENFAMLRRKDDGTKAVVLANPMSKEFQIVRTSLLPGLCKTLKNNKSVSSKQGIRIFEVSDVCLLDDTTDVGARNERMVAAAYCGATTGIEVIHGFIDGLMDKLDVESCAAIKEEADAEARKAAAAAVGEDEVKGDDADDQEVEITHADRAKELPRYTLRPISDDTFFPGRAGEIVLLQPSESDDAEGLRLGVFGVLHPEVLSNFKIHNLVSVVEMSLEPLL